MAQPQRKPGRTNCLWFALAIFWWRLRRWRADPSRPEPCAILRTSRIEGGPFHVLAATQRYGPPCPHCGSTGSDRYSTISWKPPGPDKPTPLDALSFAGSVRRGDDRRRSAPESEPELMAPAGQRSDLQ